MVSLMQFDSKLSLFYENNLSLLQASSNLAFFTIIPHCNQCFFSFNVTNVGLFQQVEIGWDLILSGIHCELYELKLYHHFHLALYLLSAFGLVFQIW